MRGPLKALDQHLAAQNRERRERISPLTGPANRYPSVPDGRYRVTYRYAADHEWMTYTHQANDPADLVRFMRDHFHGNEHLIVCRVFEMPPTVEEQHPDFDGYHRERG